MAIGPPNDTGVLPVFAQAFGHVLDDTPTSVPLAVRATKDGDNGGPA